MSDSGPRRAGVLREPVSAARSGWSSASQPAQSSISHRDPNVDTRRQPAGAVLLGGSRSSSRHGDCSHGDGSFQSERSLFVYLAHFTFIRSARGSVSKTMRGNAQGLYPGGFNRQSNKRLAKRYKRCLCFSLGVSSTGDTERASTLRGLR